jgi:anthranilate synthase component 2
MVLELLKETAQRLILEIEDKILFINNKDSFVYNLVDYICRIAPKCKLRIVDNSESMEAIASFNPDKIFISPGPGHPKYETGNVINVIRTYKDKVPIFGICLGHQAICEAFGEDDKIEYVGRAKVGPKHGKISKIFHDGGSDSMIFKGITNPVGVIRYHSLAAKADILPQCLSISAMADDGTIMAVRHKDYPIFGVQFHPESIMMKPHGIRMIYNFLSLPK